MSQPEADLLAAWREGGDEAQNEALQRCSKKIYGLNVVHPAAPSRRRGRHTGGAGEDLPGARALVGTAAGARGWLGSPGCVQPSDRGLAEAPVPFPPPGRPLGRGGG